jgi:hypothetical protein
LNDTIGRWMRVTFGEKLRGIQRASLFDNAVNQEMVFAPKQDNISAAHIIDGNLSNEGDVLGPDPGLHAGAMNAEGNPAVALERTGNLEHIVRAALSANPFQFLPVFFPILHEAPMSKIWLQRLYFQAFKQMQAQESCSKQN